MSSSDTGSSMVLGVAVVVLGFVAWRTYTQQRTAATQPAQQQGMSKGLQNAVVGTSLATSLINALTGKGSATSVSNPSSTGSLSSLLGWGDGTEADGGTSALLLPQTYTSGEWNPDEISSDIDSDTLSAMGAAGQSTWNTWGFTL